MLIPDPVALGAVVRKRRSALGMSQTQLATQVGTTRQWLSRFEQGTNDVSIAIVFAILRALELEIQITNTDGSAVVPASTTEPLSVAPAVSASPVVNPETATDRFALLRSRDALAGLSMPGWAPRVQSSDRLSAAPAAAAPAAPDLGNQETPAADSGETTTGASLESLGDAGPKATDDKAKSQQRHQVIAMPVRPGPKASHRMDQDIARIKKSSLFKR